MSKNKEKKKLSLYTKSLIVFALVLLVLGGCFISYVYRSLVSYEENLVENIMDTMLKDGSLAKKYNGKFDVSSYEKSSNVEKSLKALYKDDNIKYKLNKKLSTDEIYIYDIILDDVVITNVSLKLESSETKMALLTINKWSIKDINYNFENGFYSYEITIPSNYKLTINGKEVKNTDVISETADKKLERLANYVDIPKTKTYSIKNLLTKPDIKITKDGKDVNYEVNKNKITVEGNYKDVSYDELKKSLKGEIDVLNLAQNWSLFLTNDLKGGMRGFNTLEPFLIKGSYMYDMARNWAVGIDITFTSAHTLLNPVFTDESVGTCTIYNENAFSCEVKLIKHMRLRNGELKDDEMHDDLFFVYYDNAYKLVDMQSKR